MAGLQSLVDEAVATALDQFGALGLRADELAVTLIDLRDLNNPVRAEYRGDAPVYPASVVKLFYLVAAHRQMADGKISDAPELRRALHDMIVRSGNESTGYVLDVLTDTTSGPELCPDEFAEWLDKRNAVNRYFESLGYTGINANRKTWNEGPYGRDWQAVQPPAGSKNFLTSNATARLLVDIATGGCISTHRCGEMLQLLRRDLTEPTRADHQAFDFIGAVLPTGAKLWSKAGYMSVARHDAALVEMPDDGKFVLVIFTERHSDAKEIIPTIGRQIVDGFLKI
jgi:beta-lactamase class A